MKIAEVRERAVPIASSIRNAYIDFSKMNVSVVALISDVVRNGEPLIGYGFNSNGRYAQSGLLRERFIPRLLDAQAEEIVDENANIDPEKVWQVLLRNEKPGGHGERSTAVGIIDMAVWDLAAKIADMPLFQLLAERYGDGRPDDDVFVYAAGGYYQPEGDLVGLQDELRGYIDAGYTVVKMKIAGAPLDEDLKRIEAALQVTDAHGAKLAVDANGRLGRRDAVAYAEALRNYDLFWFEEAGDPLDFALQAEVASAYDRPLATGENLFSSQDARNLCLYGGLRPSLDYLQMDPVLSYGLVEYMRTLDAIGKLGWSPRRCIPHGGHQMALGIAAGIGLGGNESYPGIFQPFGGFADDFLVESGRVRLPDAPGIGFEQKRELIRLFRDIAGR